MKTSLSDLNEYLFDALDRITSDDLSEEQLEKEIKRTGAVTKIAEVVISNAATQLKAYEMAAEYGAVPDVAPVTKLIDGGTKND